MSLRSVAILLSIGAILAPVVLVTQASTAAEPPGASKSQGSTEVIPRTVESTSDVASAAIHWELCGNSLVLTNYTGSLGCSIAASHGFVHLGPRTNGARRLEICHRSDISAAMHGIIRPVGRAPIWYNDQPGGGCYIRQLGYRIDRWRAYFNGIYSPWIHA